MPRSEPTRHGRDDTRRHRPGRASPAAARLGTVPVLDGPEPLQLADRQGAGPRRVGRAGHDRAVAAGAHRHDHGGGYGGRGRDRRGLRRRQPQGQPGRRRRKGRPGRRRRLRGDPGRGTLAKEKPPVLGLLQRGGAVIVRMLADVRQATIRPVIEAGVAEDALVHTDEYDIHARLAEWGYGHKTVWPRPRRVRPRRGWRRLLRGARQYGRGLLVAATVL